MNTYDVIIVGGGVAGMQCALVLGSAMNEEWGREKKILLLDDNRSDIRSAVYNNVLGITPHTVGEDFIGTLRTQLEQYSNITYKKTHVVSAREEEGSFTVQTKDDEAIKGTIVVLATGFNMFKIDGLELEVQDNEMAYKPQKVQLAHQNFKIRENLYVAGLLAAGVSSQYSIAAGSGAQVAAHIMKEWAGENVVIHDKP